MSLSFRLLTCCAALAMLPAGQAFAADYDPPIFVEEAPEWVPVEIGTGWYLRGDVSYNANKSFDSNVFGPDPVFRYRQHTVPIVGSIGAGYQITDFFRAEANIGLLTSDTARVDYRNFYPFLGLSDVGVRARNTMWSGLINLYGDLGTVAGFTPYVGAGMGLVMSTYDYRYRETMRDRDFGLLDVDFRDRSRDYSFAYSLGAGVAYKLSSDLSLDVGYQYLAAPSAKYVEMTGPDSYAVRRGLDFHQVKVGLRYSLW